MSKIEPIPTMNNLVIYEKKPAQEPSLTASVGMSKPENWPAVMAWPPKRLAVGIKNRSVNSENAGKFQAYYEKYAEKTLSQSRRFMEEVAKNRHIDEDLSRNHNALFRRIRIKKRFDYDETTRHNHVTWASALDPNGEYMSPFNKFVSSYGLTTARTVDGGEVNTTVSSLNVRTWSDQAAALMIEEALARGWESVTIRGNAKFVNAMMKQAKARGLAVEGKIDRFGGLLAGLGARTVKSMDVMPLDVQAHKELDELLKEINAEEEAQKQEPEMVADSDEDPSDDQGQGPKMP